MSSIFPLNLPGPTAFYTGLFVATLVVHFFFMSYVLAGTVWILANSLVPRHGSGETAAVLRDWMPVMLSGAITAGVAPLLFIQILYREQFYTANLLQFHRWMAILPVLIVLFYLLYVVKALHNRNPLWQRLAAAICVACVMFVAWSWTANHQLSLQTQEIWQEHYAGVAASNTSAVLARLLLWVSLTFTVLPVLLAWQRRDAVQLVAGRVAFIALVAAALLASLLLRQFPEEVRLYLTSAAASPWIAAAVGGWLLQLGGWLWRLRTTTTGGIPRWLVSVGVVCQLAGIMMLREMARVATLSDRINFARHAEAADQSGLWLFLFFCLLNAIIAAWCIHLVQRTNKTIR